MNRSIGVFDSGVGGLTVLKSLIAFLPNESYIYIGDNKNCPYGDKTIEELYEYSKRIIEYFIKQNVKLIVIACNTISSNILEKLQNSYQNTKIIGVIDATIKEFVKTNIDEVLIMATNNTIESNTYDNKIKRANCNIKTINLKTPLLVPAIEENNELDNIVKEYLLPYQSVKAIILGCTHYPLALDYIKKYTNAIIISSSDAVANEVYNYLKNNKLLGSIPKINIYTTGNITLFKEISKSIINQEVEYLNM